METMKRTQCLTRPSPSRWIVMITAVLALALGSVVGGGIGPAAAATGPISAPITSLVVPVGGKITPVQFSASGATSFASDPLPAGLTLSATGLLDGRPLTQSPKTDYTITATDTVTSTTMLFSITVVPIVLAPTTAITGTIGQPLGAGFAFKPEGFFTPTFSTTPTLPWLSFDVNGVMSGVPTAPLAPFTLFVTVTDQNGVSATASASMSISATSLSPASQVLTGKVGTALSPAGASFPAGSYTSTPDIFALTGLTLSSTTGAVSGTPTKPIPPTAFVIQQLGAGGAVQSDSSLSLTIDGFLGSATPITIAAGVPVAPVAPFGPGAAQIAGLVGAVTFSVAPALPNGLLLDSATGVISGTPLVATARDYLITATDSQGAKASGNVTLGVTGQLVPANQTLTGSVASSLSSGTYTASGMKAPITYSISPTPAGGLQFDTNSGILSGIPTVAIATSSYVVTATDSLGSKATANITLTVSKTTLTVPVIGSVVGGTQIGSIIVYFARPSFAPAGQTYTVKVSDASGLNLVTSLTTTSSPATVTGLVGGETYEVVVVANASSSFDAVESLPKSGVASASATAATDTTFTGTSLPVNLASAGRTPSSSSSQVGALTDVGITVASTTQAKKAGKAFAIYPPSPRKKKAPVVKVPLDTYVTVVLPRVKVKGKILVEIQIDGQYVSLGSVKADADKQLLLPTLSSSEPGKYLVRLTPKAGNPGYVRLEFSANSGSKPSSSSSSSSAGF
jgi:hypothetical protein